VMNYKAQIECDVDMDILTLRALVQILRYSKDYLRNKLEMKAAKNERLDRELSERTKEEGSFGFQKTTEIRQDSKPQSPPSERKEQEIKKIKPLTIAQSENEKIQEGLSPKKCFG